MNNNKPENKKFWTIKKEIRILGIDDGPFTPHSNEKALIIGVMFRAGFWLDGVLSTNINVDGHDSTSQIIEMVNKSRHKSQLGVIMLDGLTVGGFNVINIREVFLKTGIPVIVIMRKYPNLEKIKKALKRFYDWKSRWNTIKDAGEIYQIEKHETIFMQIKGISREDAEEIVRLSTTRSAIPEPIRVAHIIASGVVNGESRGSA
jgi:endonuclease V-like protein UPF0215 family